MSAVPFRCKTIAIALLCTVAIGAQEQTAEKPPPVAPTIRLPLSRLKPDATIEIAGNRMMTPGADGIWVAGAGAGTVVRIDTKTNKPGDPIAVGKEPCAGVVTGFGSLLVPVCGEPGLARVDLKTNAAIVVARGHAITAGPVTAVGSIWFAAGRRLIRIDPESNAIVADQELGASALAMAFGQGALWIATENNELLRISPFTIVTGEIIKVGRSPRAIAIGEGAVWTLNAGDGSVSRVDPKTNKVANTIRLGAPLASGQLAVGEGAVWVSAPGLPLVRIDPRTNHIVQSFSGDGGGAILVAQGAIWITAAPKTIWRLDPKLIDATRR